MLNDRSKQISAKQLAAITSVVRGELAEPTGNPDIPYNPVILKSLTNKEAVDFASSGKNAKAKKYPSPLKKGKAPPLFLEAINIKSPSTKFRKQLRDSVKRYSARYNSKPKIICLENLGIFFIEHSNEKSELPLKNKVALVTGAAGAIGYGVCQGLLKNGCHLVATDLPGDNLENFIIDLKEILPECSNRVTGVPIDVTDKESVVWGFERVIQKWGGIDIVVVNAGIPLVKKLKDIKLDKFRSLEKVNVEGALLTLAEAARIFILQRIGGDIIVVSTKNVPSPGRGFGAYSATKAACHQLGRIASLELARYGVRVNMVAPDAVFGEGKYKSKLWKTIGPSRMKARKLKPKQLHKHYQNRNLLKAKITERHVSNAVLFFATRQTPTTGVTIPVDGGLPDATPR